MAADKLQALVEKWRKEAERIFIFYPATALGEPARTQIKTLSACAAELEARLKEARDGD